MHTHNINVKTAAQKTPERCGQGAEQQSLFLQLAGVWNLQLSERDEAEEIHTILSVMVNNVHMRGVIDWYRDKPLVSWDIVIPWLKAKKLAVREYGETGKQAIEYFQKVLNMHFEFEDALIRMEND